MDNLSKQKNLIPISQAAIVLGVSIDTIRRWDKSGVLHSQRLDGKNRYFSPDELKEYKLKVPLSISEVARNLNISSTTLRRLEMRGLIKPKRNNAGERIYDQDLIKSFLNSDYFLRKKPIKEKISEPFQEEKELVEIPNINLTPRPKRRINEFITASTILFLLLFTFSIRNIWAFEFSNAKSQPPTITPDVLSAVKEVSTAPAAVSTAPTEATEEATPKITVTVKINDGSDYVNIRQKPTVSSNKVGQAKAGESFELMSKNSGWFEIKLASGSAGFISAKYIKESN